MRLTNNSPIVQDFVVKGAAKDGVPPTESLAPGETKDIDVVDENAASVQGRLIAGTVSAASAQKKAKE